MNTLYQHFIQQIKREQIDQYNRKHRDYLIRTGKLNINVKNNTTRNTGHNKIINQNSTNTNAQNMPQQKQQVRKPRRQRQFQVNKPNNQITHNIHNSSSIIVTNSIHIDNIANQMQRPIGERKQNRKNSLPEKKQETILPQQIPKIQYNNTIVQNVDERIPLMQKKQQPQQQYQQIELVECPSGCGRKFAPKALTKHSKVCQKVFQQKRKPFEVQKTDQEAQILKDQKEAKTSDKDKAKQKQQKQKKTQKWKRQSNNFRNQMKVVRGETAEVVIEDDRIQCPVCSRKFNENAADRHIQFCKKKNQQKR